MGMKTIEEIRRQKLRLLAEERGGSAKLASFLDISPAQLSQWINASPDSKTGKPRAVSTSSARTIEMKCGKPTGWMDQDHDAKMGALIDLDEHPEYSAIRRVKFKLSAGVSGYEVEYLNGHRAPIFFRRDWLEVRSLLPQNLMAVEVTGQSMEPSLFEGDLVVVNVADTTPRDGEVFAANYDGELVIKRLMRDAGEWYLYSDNSDKRRYPSKLCDERTIIVGRIVHKQSERI